MDNYQKKLASMVRTGEIPAGQMGNALARHDKWCGKLKGGRCNCDPDIEWMPAANEDDFILTFLALNGLAAKQ